MVEHRIERVIAEAKFTEYAQVDVVKVAKAIAQLRQKCEFSTGATANKYREAMMV